MHSSRRLKYSRDRSERQHVQQLKLIKSWHFKYKTIAKRASLHAYSLSKKTIKGDGDKEDTEASDAGVEVRVTRCSYAEMSSLEERKLMPYMLFLVPNVKETMAGAVQ